MNHSMFATTLFCLAFAVIGCADEAEPTDAEDGEELVDSSEDAVRRDPRAWDTIGIGVGYDKAGCRHDARMSATNRGYRLSAYKIQGNGRCTMYSR